MKQPQSPILSRAQWVNRLFPQGVPSLWCPPLTHYDDAGAIDQARITAHLRFMSPWVKGLLAPGSTGDGWELSAVETRRVLEVILDAVRPLNLRLLMGALRPSATETVQTIQDSIGLIEQRAGSADPVVSLLETHVCGFTVCPPRGSAVTQPEMESALSSVLELGVPIALYQLPQVTQNEMSPALVARLAARFSNFLLLKDTSGRDAVAASSEDFGGVFLVRGMEGDYARWLKSARGPYDGFLLSTANCFGAQLHAIVEAVNSGRKAEAAAISQKLTSLVTEMFSLVGGLPDGNAFSNANKAMDHFFAYGPQATLAPPPRLHSGQRLPVEVIRATEALLRRHQLMPARGYLE